MDKRTMRILIPTGHLGTAPFQLDSFRRGMETRPDVVIADAGSSDPGPVYLGADTALGFFEEEDLENLLVASRKIGVPLLIGSAGDSGANTRVDKFVGIIQRLAEKHRIPKFRLGYFYSDVSKEYLKQKLRAGAVIEGLGGFPPLREDVVERTSRIVGVAGIHPYIKLLDQGADVIIGGRSGDIAMAAAPAIRAGFPAGLAYHMGKMLECASLCAEPFMGKETVIGTLSDDDIKLTPYHPDQKCTIASAGSHSMYERETPFFEYAVGGMLDLRECKFEQFDARTCRITGAKWIPSEKIMVKLEGSARVGERYIGLAAIRDPYLVQHVEDILQWCRTSVAKKFGKEEYQLYFHVFGKNGVLKELEPVQQTRAHELCIVTEGIAPTRELAEKITDLATRMMFLARIPGVKGTAGAAASIEKRPMLASPAYEWTLNHLVQVDDPLELFPTHLTDAGV